MSDESPIKADHLTVEVIEAAQPGDTVFLHTHGLTKASASHRGVVMDSLKDMAERYGVQLCVFDADVLEVMSEERMAELGWFRRSSKTGRG